MIAPVGKLQGSTRHSILTDHLGTPLELIDQNGQRTWQAETTAYGRIRLEAGTRADAECPFRFQGQGQYEDVETGLYYNRFRRSHKNSKTPKNIVFWGFLSFCALVGIRTPNLLIRSE
ncbi:MAG: hypothetical protein EOO39_17655, partial [Cytophagaceae bacterium]